MRWTYVFEDERLGRCMFWTYEIRHRIPSKKTEGAPALYSRTRGTGGLGGNSMSSFVMTFATAELSTLRIPLTILFMPCRDYESKPHARGVPSCHCGTVGSSRLDREKIE